MIEAPPDWARASEPHPKNAPGPFYVANTECMACGYRHVLGPDLMAWGETEGQFGTYTHCYFAKQPETPEETEKVIMAVQGSCCGALRHEGTDREILKRLG